MRCAQELNLASRKISPGRRRFLVAALWVPIFTLVALMIIDWVAGYSKLADWTQFLMIHVLAFGIPAYVVFAACATPMLSKATEQQILKKIWFAPLRFIPFYAAPWVFSGLALLILGKGSGLPMMFGWLAFLPYMLVVGYALAALTLGLYKTIFQ